MSKRLTETDIILQGLGILLSFVYLIAPALGIPVFGPVAQSTLATLNGVPIWVIGLVGLFLVFYGGRGK